MEKLRAHRKAECIGSPLQWWEQMKLKEILWPKTSSNFARISGAEAGLRYRDIENSNWRSRDLQVRMKEEAETYQNQVPSFSYNIPELTFEQFTGETITKNERNYAQSMSVVLGFEEEEGKSGQQKKDYTRAESESLLGKAVAPLRDHELKAFRVPVTIRTRQGRKDVNVNLPARMAQADQGSDMIIVTIGFLKKLGLPMKSLSEKGFNGLTMNVADGSSAKSTGNMEEGGSFVRPFASEDDEEVHLLLGMPWLHAVDAKIRIRDSIIEIGDEAQAEKIVKLQGPKFVESEIHKLILCPKEKEQVDFEDSSGEYDSDVEDSSDEEDASDDENLSDLFEEDSEK
ncbi:hypothetical protein EPUL_004698, partial [Erysiphe pulchra]